MEEYHKIYGPWRRATEGPDRNRVIPGAWTYPEFEYLADVPWLWTEKVDGTNVRVHWDGHTVEFGGRTANAQMPATLVARLRDLFIEEIFEQSFGASSVTLYGEGFGPGIQKGGRYGDKVDFALFDVKIGKWWLTPDNVVDIAGTVGCSAVPRLPEASLNEMIAIVSLHRLTSAYGDFAPEGAVGVPAVPLFDRRGNRIICKVKYADFH